MVMARDTTSRDARSLAVGAYLNAQHSSSSSTHLLVSVHQLVCRGTLSCCIGLSPCFHTTPTWSHTMHATWVRVLAQGQSTEQSHLDADELHQWSHPGCADATIVCRGCKGRMIVEQPAQDGSEGTAAEPPRHPPLHEPLSFTVPQDTTLSTW